MVPAAIYEIKFNGGTAVLRCVAATKTRVLSRNEKDLGGKFPEVQNSIAALNVQDAIIDGRIVHAGRQRPGIRDRRIYLTGRVSEIFWRVARWFTKAS